MTTKDKTTKKAATAYAVSIQIFCPECATSPGSDPIPSPDGSFLWETLPDKVTCGDCGGTFAVGRRILH